MKKSIIVGNKPKRPKILAVLIYLGIVSFLGISSYFTWVVKYFPGNFGRILCILVVAIVFICLISIPLFSYEFWEINNNMISIFSYGKQATPQKQLNNVEVAEVKDTPSIFFNIQYNIDMLQNKLNQYTINIPTSEIEKMRLRWHPILGFHGQMSYPVYLQFSLKDASSIETFALAYTSKATLVKALYYLTDICKIPLEDTSGIFEVLQDSKQELYDYLDTLNKKRG